VTKPRETSMSKRPIAIFAAAVLGAIAFTLSKPAQAGCQGCKAASYPAYYYFYGGVVAPTFYYGGFYTPRVVFAPVRTYYTPYGPVVIVGD
jgi:hypothetical protein